MSVKVILQQAGLGHLVPAFQGLSVERFKSLLIQDYEKHGVRDMADKQALFKVIKDLANEDCSLTLSPENSGITSHANSSPDPAAKYLARLDPEEIDDVQLLDLEGDDDDDDFLVEDELEAAAFSQAFMRSATPDRGIYPPSAAASTTSQAASRPPAADASGNGGGAPGGGGDLSRTHSTAASASSAPIVATSADDPASSLAAIADPPRIRVIVRKRPMNKKELDKGEQDVLECDPDNATLYVHEPKVKVDLTRYTECHSFRFDDVFDEDVDNDALYSRAVRPLIATIFRAGRGTCFAYGQTGSGKTYTMQPLPLRAAADIFRVTAAVPEFAALSLHVACYEIYGGKVFDLLNARQKLEVREDAKKRVQVVGLKEVQVADIDTLMRLCEHAASARSTGCTGANDESSRSHSIMTFALRTPAPPPTATGPGNGPRPRPTAATRSGQPDAAGPPLRTVGKLSFIDLAGSERGADTYDNDKQTRLEGAEINKSLLALKECIRALDMDAGHIPFRGSKLTSVLRDSFVGKNARTVMIANVSPSSNSCEHTVNTLRYADRVKEMKKDAPRPGVVAAAAAAAAGVNGGGGGASGGGGESDGGANEIAALLHKMPPPSLPEPLPAAGAQQQQQHQQAAAAAGATPMSPTRQNRHHQQPLSPNKGRTGTGGLAFTPTAPAIGGGGGNGGGGGGAPSPHKATRGGGGGGETATAAANRANGTTAAAPAPTPAVASPTSPSPAKAFTPSPVHSHHSSARTSTSGQQQQTASSGGGGVGTRPPRRTGSLSAHPLVATMSDSSLASGGPSIDAAMAALLAAEEELIGAHRQHIETTMGVVKEEMELLAQLDDSEGNGMTIDAYLEELSNILVDKAAAVAALQQQVTAFRRQLRAAQSS